MFINSKRLMFEIIQIWGHFLINRYRAILVFGLVGFFGAVLFNKTSPEEYEAILVIKMIDAYDYFGVSSKVEDPSLLIARLKLPSTYSQKEVDSCFLSDAKSPREELVSKVTATLVGRVDSIVQLKIKRPKKELAQRCAQAIYDMINDQQLRIKAGRDSINSIMLSNYSKQYKELSSRNMSGYEREKIQFLLEKISNLDYGNLAGQSEVTLIAPIYTTENPLWLKRGAILVIGFLIGLFLGWVILNGVQIWKIYSVKKINRISG